jgi:hypothetical protein
LVLSLFGGDTTFISMFINSKIECGITIIRPQLHANLGRREKTSVLKSFDNIASWSPQFR